MLLIYATQGYDKQIILEDRTDASVVRRGDQINIPRVRTLVEEWEVYLFIINIEVSYKGQYAVLITRSSWFDSTHLYHFKKWLAFKS